MDEGDITLSERVNGWVQCLTFVLGLLKDQPHLRISTALEPIDVMFGGNSRMHVSVLTALAWAQEKKSGLGTRLCPFTTTYGSHC